MSDSVDRVFVHALNTVKRIPRTGSARPPEADRLKLYGLYKQSTEGNVEGLMPRPQGSSKEDTAEREKWDAWNSFANLSRTEAKRQYISTLIAAMHRYATTTPEARELVSELEFVWDQIKSNSASSSAESSPGQQQQQLQSERNQSRRRRRRTDDSDEMDRTKPSGIASGGRQSVREAAPEQIKVGAGVEQVLRRLKPMSDGDEKETIEDPGDDSDEAEEDGEGLQRGGNEGEEQAITQFNNPTLKSRQQSDLDIRNRKWRKRIESALVKLSVEVAALREQMEASSRTGTSAFFNSGGRSPRGFTLSWIAWMFTATVKHILLDAAVLALLVAWARRRRRRRGQKDGIGNTNNEGRMESGLIELGHWVWDLARSWRMLVFKQAERVKES